MVDCLWVGAAFACERCNAPCMKTLGIPSAFVKFRESGVVARPLAKVLPLPKPGSPRETRAHLTVILCLLKVRSNWVSYILESNRNGLCGVWAQVIQSVVRFGAIVINEVGYDLPPVCLPVYQGKLCQSCRGLQGSSCNEIPCLLCADLSFPHVAPLLLDGKRPPQLHTTPPGRFLRLATPRCRWHKLVARGWMHRRRAGCPTLMPPRWDDIRPYPYHCFRDESACKFGEGSDDI